MTKNIKAVQNASAELRAIVVGEETMLAVASEAATMVKIRAGQGVDADGSNFPEYTEAYKKKRVASGRSERPNLTWSGRMLNSIQAQYIEPGRARVGFSRTESAQIAAGNTRYRDFFDIRLPEEISKLTKILDDKIARLLKRVGL